MLTEGAREVRFERVATGYNAHRRLRRGRQERHEGGTRRVAAATISREDLKANLDREDNFVLVETLSEEQYRHAHLPGAVNLPPDRVRELASEVLSDKDADVVVYCGSPQ